MKTPKQTQIAKKAEISDAFLSEILAGKKSPSWRTAKRLQKTTGVPVILWMESRKFPEKIKKALTTSSSTQEAS